MTIDKSNDEFDETEALLAVSSCLQVIGSPQFNKTYIDLANRLLAADQCMIFSYGSEAPRCFLSYNNRPKGEARALAARYVDCGYADDPIRLRMQRMDGADGIEIVPLDELRGEMSIDYWQAYFDSPELVDKVAILANRGELQLCLNFYRYAESGPYSSSFMQNADTLFRIAAQLALQHYQCAAGHWLEDPLQTLSEREQLVCRWILKGLTTDAIAYEMGISPNTVATFRKRAYEKLSINSKTALFTLCRW